jgi:hypothetical protein
LESPPKAHLQPEPRANLFWTERLAGIRLSNATLDLG